MLRASSKVPIGRRSASRQKESLAKRYLLKLRSWKFANTYVWCYDQATRADHLKDQTMAKITLHKDDDPGIEAAAKRAKGTFRYFWRELSWEYRRIVPGLDLAVFKVAFTDGDDPPAEVMWVNEVNFDGYSLTGRLLNQPNWLKSINEGDQVKVPIKAITDWLYAIEGVAYGGFSVNAIRKQMGKRERKQHDDAWGMDFGDPDKVHLVPANWYQKTEPKKAGFFGFGKSAAPEPLTDDFLQKNEHPMAANMAPSIKEFATKNSESLSDVGDNGLTMLHQVTLSGSAIGIKALLECGADVNSRSKKGHTALDFAKSLGWKRAYAMLTKHGGKSATK